MKKAWLMLVAASGLLLLAIYIIPKDLLNSGTSDEFEQLLNEQMQDSAAFDKITISAADTIPIVTTHTVKENSLKEEKLQQDSLKKLTESKQLSLTGLEKFFKKLQDLEHNKKGKIRIAFFGDSMEDSDMIVMQFRHFLQKKFGGMGVGFVPITSADAKGRYSIKHRFTHNWNKSNFLKKGTGRFHFGLNGTTFYVGDSVWADKATVRFKKGGAYQELPLINPTLFYGKEKKDETNKDTKAEILLVTKDTTKHLQLKPKKLLNSYRLPNFAKEFAITIKDQQSIPFYGVSFASNNGVIVDNLSVRGNSGLPLMKLNYNLMRTFDKYLQYDLLVFAYGTNVFSFKNEKYDWYQRRMIQIVKYMQKCYQNANVLIVSMGDRSTKIDGVMQTPAHLPDFIELQHDIARKSKSGFYNLYDAMGGSNSMVRWVEKDALANKDYTHLNSKGAGIMGKKMFDWLMLNYKQYKKQKKQKGND